MAALEPGEPRPDAAAALLMWADRHHRELPWRRSRDPWAVLVSEVMLQQTQVDRVVPRYESFLARWPTPTACAAAPLADVLTEWVGLGYPRRARNLHRTAVTVVERHDGCIPLELPALLELPGVGPYTARAVMAFAGEHDVGVVDTNIGRVLARWSGRPLAAGEAQTLADRWVPDGSGWAWNQGLMDFGATCCTKRRPNCPECPMRPWCSWRSDPESEDPAHLSAAVSRRQAPYQGSDRQARGALLRALTSGPLETDSAVAAMALTDDPDRAERLLVDLHREGLVTRSGERIELGSVE